MTFLDVGANRGYYTLLASRIVGRAGRVIAFEPSPRERRFLKLNLLFNGCCNVRLEPTALGREPGEADLFVVQGYSAGCNCLRVPDTREPSRAVRVRVDTLDEYLFANGVGRVDFVKMDVEGGELDVLKGAPRLLTRRPRPVILCELLDLRTRPWGYEARETVRYLEQFDFSWFGISPEGAIDCMPDGSDGYDGNFIAVPQERLAGLRAAGRIP